MGNLDVAVASCPYLSQMMKLNQKGNHTQDIGRLEFALLPADKLLRVDVLSRIDRFSLGPIGGGFQRGA